MKAMKMMESEDTVRQVDTVYQKDLVAKTADAPAVLGDGRNERQCAVNRGTGWTVAAGTALSLRNWDRGRTLRKVLAEHVAQGTKICVSVTDLWGCQQAIDLANDFREVMRIEHRINILI